MTQKISTTSVVPSPSPPQKSRDAELSPKINWCIAPLFIGIGQSLMLFSSPPPFNDVADVDAIAQDVECVLHDFAVVLQRHGHILDEPGVKSDVV